MEDLVKLQDITKEIDSNMDTMRNNIARLLKQLNNMMLVNDQDIIPPRHLRDVLDVIRTKKDWTSNEIITLFREVSLVIVSEQRLQRRKT